MAFEQFETYISKLTIGCEHFFPLILITFSELYLVHNILQ